MLAQKEYYVIKIKDNDLATVYKVDNDNYNYLQYKAEYVYHTKNGDIYPLEKTTTGIDNIFVDDEHINALLDDIVSQEFCDEVIFDGGE